MTRCWFFGFTSSLALLSSAFASNWPQLLGPARNGVADEKDLATNWPASGPRVLWRKKIGDGFAAPVVADGKLVRFTRTGNTNIIEVILFTRTGDTETVEAVNANDGKTLWAFPYPTAYRDSFGFDPGPRATPTVADGKIFTFGADSMLLCLNLTDGKKLWSVDCKKTYAAPKGFFGLACSPLVEGRAVIVNVGGRTGDGGASVVAFDKDTGSVLWSAFDDEPSYSSPIAATFGAQRTALVLTRNWFLGLDPANGHIRFRHEFRLPERNSVTGATPTVVGDRVFLSAAYDLGAMAFRVTGDKLEKLWAGDDQLTLQFTTAVHRDGFLYGLHGRHDFPGGTELRCVEFATGKVRWGKPGLSGANVILAGDSLLVLTENGELLRVAAGPEKFRELARAQILGRGVRAYPALADGRFYARDKAQLVCVDLK